MLGNMTLFFMLCVFVLSTSAWFLHCQHFNRNCALCASTHSRWLYWSLNSIVPPYLTLSFYSSLWTMFVTYVITFFIIGDGMVSRSCFRTRIFELQDNFWLDGRLWHGTIIFLMRQKHYCCHWDIRHATWASSKYLKFFRYYAESSKSSSNM